MDQSLKLDNPFWQFSLQVYAAPGVAQECLMLQDESGVSVNMLLYCAWRGTQGDALSASRIEKLNEIVEKWRSGVIKPLRSIRRSLPGVTSVDAVAREDLRSKILDAEIRAEQIEQALLFGETDSHAGRGDKSASTIDANLNLYLSGYQRAVSSIPVLRRLLSSWR